MSTYEISICLCLSLCTGQALHQRSTVTPIWQQVDSTAKSEWRHHLTYSRPPLLLKALPAPPALSPLRHWPTT
jgi:hypothetical protein